MLTGRNIGSEKLYFSVLKADANLSSSKNEAQELMGSDGRSSGERSKGFKFKSHLKLRRFSSSRALGTAYRQVQWYLDC